MRSRGVNQEFNVKEVGWKLRNLNLPTTSNGNCKVLKFSSEVRYHIHKWMLEIRLQLPFKRDCLDCQGLQTTQEKRVE
jgi:hypothetical protein